MERDKFCFTGLDVTTVEDNMQSLKDIKEIRKADQDEHKIDQSHRIDIILIFTLNWKKLNHAYEYPVTYP